MQDWKAPWKTWPNVFTVGGMGGSVSATGSGDSGAFVGAPDGRGTLLRPIPLDRVVFNLSRLMGLAIHFSWESVALPRG